MANSTRQCYFPSGGKSGDVPCADGVSGCCTSSDLCLSNGLCLNVGHQPYVLSRGSCTDSNWGDGCPKWCKDIDPTKGSSIINLKFENLISTYCCGTPISNGTDVICPYGADSFQIPSARAVPGVALLSNVPSLAGTDLSPSSSPSPSSVPTDAAAPTCHDTAIGAGVGVPLGIVAVLSIAWALFERRARRQLTRQGSPAVSNGWGARSTKEHAGSPSELPLTLHVPELMGRDAA